MIVAGFDMSKLHYGMVIREFLDTKNFLTDYTFAWSSKDLVEKAKKKEYQAHYVPSWDWYKKNVSNDKNGFTLYLCDVMTEFVEQDLFYIGEEYKGTGEKYIAIEGPAYGGSGQILQIAEVISAVTRIFYHDKWKIRIHDPLTVKLWAVDNGRSEKEPLRIQAVKDGLRIPEIIFEHDACYDICDAYFLMKMLEAELKVRENPLAMNEMEDRHKKVFNRVTQANPINLISRDFISYREFVE